MKRPFPRFEVLGLTAALALVSSCSPNNSVKPGAPVLTELSILEPGANGPTATTITASTVTCPGGTGEGGFCDPTATNAVCAQVITNSVCRCLAAPMTAAAPPPATDAGTDAGADAGAKTGTDAGAKTGTDAGADAGGDAGAPPPAGGAWSCSFAPTSMVMYVFDRVLDTAPLDPGDAAGLTTLATTKFDPDPATPVVLVGDYASNGSPNEIIFPLLGDFRSDGPNILFTGEPALPTSRSITVTLDKTKVLAKDGRTPFTGVNLLQDGMVSFITKAFTATVAGPPPPAKPADAGADAAAPLPAPDMTPATVTFSNTIDTATLPNITASATPTGGGAPAPVPVDLASMNGLTVTVTPKTTWPASSTITITVPADAKDLAGDVLGTPVDMPTFTTSAM